MSKYRILIVDDDDDARRLLGMALRPRYEIVEASDGLDALSKIEALEPDFAIIDIMMPLMDGYQVCEAIRKHPRFKTMQVMFLSAFGSKDNIKKSYAAGANLFMTKPVDPERVLKNIDFTIQHEPPPLRAKKYTIEQIEKFESGEEPGPAMPSAAPQVAPPPAAAAPRPMPPREPVPPPRLGSADDAAPSILFAAKKQPAQPAGPQPRVLVVDDDPEMLQMVEMALRDDYEVTTASNGLDAIERMVDYEPDLMLMDIMMPKMNGYQLLQSIRRNSFFRSLPVIVVSAKSTPRDKEYAARLGATNFIAKPYHLDALLDAIRAVIVSPEFKIGRKTLNMAEIRERLRSSEADRVLRSQENARRRQLNQLLEEPGEGS